ncbi:MAG: phosphohydrolase, partial [Methylococcales bacterium]|nr:phosphohydrolase [Methylococcales bacterium]
MIHPLINNLTIISYLLSAFLIATNRNTLPNGLFKHLKPLTLGWVAVLLHTTTVTPKLFTPEGLNLNFFTAGSLISDIVVWLFLLAALTRPIDKLAIAIFPIAALMLGLEGNVAIKPQILVNHAWQMNIHILTSIIAFSLFNIAAFQAILLAMQ